MIFPNMPHSQYEKFTLVSSSLLSVHVPSYLMVCNALPITTQRRLYLLT